MTAWSPAGAFRRRGRIVVVLLTKRIDLGQEITGVEVSWIIQRPELTLHSPVSGRQACRGLEPFPGRCGVPALP